ncbi:MAG: hypothetical protein DRN29_03175 [Thermoplasmata archaeon]|nr:MAG: hypothetical protein DRN29_03175 [Thermoplasmata archaeon]
MCNQRILCEKLKSTVSLETIMIYFQEFDSFEEMMEAIERAREEADARVQDWQREIKVGDYFEKDTPYGFNIYGEVLEEYNEPRMKNFRFCKCYSIACPEGELGDVHVSTIKRKMTKDEFEEMKRRGWM